TILWHYNATLKSTILIFQQLTTQIDSEFDSFWAFGGKDGLTIADFGRAARRLSAALRFLAMEQPLLQKRALQIATGRLAVARFVGKGQG
ncbi:MAG: hypothetical protein Q9M27_03245, partial [Mariprofundaceae bacterium]|nr:hypothetical protein [Mariprofundaceae bacterium]